MQTTLLGLAIAFIIALDSRAGRTVFHRLESVPAAIRDRGHAGGRRAGARRRRVDARLLPTPSLRLRSVVVGGANDLGKVRADKLDVEFSLGSLMRGEWRATELTINGMALDLGLDAQGRIDWPASTGTFNLGSLAIDRLNLTGRIALHDAASRGTLELNDIAFSGDVRSLAGSVRGDGNFMLSGMRYPFRVSSGQSVDGEGTRIHLNLDPGARALSADLEGVLRFETRAPRFEGVATLSVPAAPNAKGADAGPTPWRISAKVKADPAAARFEQLEASYGPDDTALKFTGLADIRFGASPLLHAVLSARQLDADRFFVKNDDKNDDKDHAAEPIRLLPGLRALMAALPQAPIPAQIEFSSEQIMLGGRPVQNFAADLHADAKSWTIDRLDFRAPGTTRVDLSGADLPPGPSGGFKGALDVESSDPDTLVAWLQGRSEITYRSQKPLQLRGKVSIGPNRFAIDAMTAEIDGGAVTGRVAVSNPSASGGSRIDAELKAERLDFDAATAFVRSVAGPQAEWPDEAQLSLDIGRALSAGQELQPLIAKLGYGPKTVTLDQLKIGQATGVMLEGTGNFDRVHTTGRLALNSTAASLARITGLIAPFAPNFSSRLNSLGTSSGPARLKLTLDLDKNAEHADRASARAVLDLDAPQLKGVATFTAKPDIAAIRAIDLDKLQRSEIGIESKLSSEQGRSLLALLGLDRAIVAGDGPAQFEGSVAGVWRAPLRLKAKISGAGLDAEAQGTAEPWASEPRASVSLTVRRANFAPLFGLKPSDALVQNIRLSSRVSLAGSKLTFDDLDSAISGSRLRGRLALTLDAESDVEGEVGLDALDVAPVFALAIGAAGRDAAEPLGAGLLKGWRGRVAFQALRGSLPGGGELRPVSGTVKSDGQSLTFDAIKGTIGGGEATASLDAKPAADGIALNARIQLRGVDGAAVTLSWPRDARRPRVDADDAVEPGPQRVGADRRVVRKRDRDAGIRWHRRAQSARLRGCDPRQRQRTGDRRRPAAADRRAGVVGRRVVGRVGANSVQYQGRPASRWRDHARRQGCACHHIRRLRYSRRPGRHSCRTGVDGGRTVDQPPGNTIVRRRFAGRPQSHRRRGGAVVMAGGAGDRSRNPPAGFDRARRIACGIAGWDSAVCNRAGCGLARPTALGCTDSRSRSAAVAAEAQGQCSASASCCSSAANRRSAANGSGTA